MALDLQGLRSFLVYGALLAATSLAHFCGTILASRGFISFMAQFLQVAVSCTQLGTILRQP